MQRDDRRAALTLVKVEPVLLEPIETISKRWVGSAVGRKEDQALLTGQARFIDDLSPVPGIRFAAILRSPHPHARIGRIDLARALEVTGVRAIITGRDVIGVIGPLSSVVKAPLAYYPMAIDKTRYVGEPIAVVVADTRYIAEDACDLIHVDYELLPAVTDPGSATMRNAPVIHENAGSNVISRRSFRYGNPDAAFAAADRVFEFSYFFPRYASTPMETFGVIAHFERAPDRYTVWSNFQGPFVVQPLIAGALRVPGHRLRLITPPSSGGSFGIKQAVLSYILLLAAVSRKTGVPVKWTEDRTEHLTAASASSDRLGTVAAAFTRDGELTGLRFKNTANMGAYIRPPEPASLYRMHAASNGCYRVKNISIDNELVVTNCTPVGLNRGYGGPQFYFALERIMEIAARGLGIDPAELRRRNFVPAGDFPYKAPAGAVFDAGDYEAALSELLRIADYDELKRRREEARRAGRLFGIGLAAGVEPSGSNMAYVSLAQTAEDRRRADPKSGANASAVLAVDPSGQVTLRLCSCPNGQGHATVAAQIVADALGLHPDEIDVATEIDTATSAWSIASGNYSNRFAAIVVDAVAKCAEQVAQKIKLLAADALDASAEEIELHEGYARVRGQSNKGLPFRKAAARAHWNPAGLPGSTSPGIHETSVVSPSILASPDDDDRIASAVTFGFVIDLAAVEIDRRTGAIRIDKYASVHDVGTQLNPKIVEGQVHGGFAHGLGAALFEELAYDDQGNFLSGTFADYLCPTAVEVPHIEIGHIATPSPANALGAKGMGDGSSMLTPAVITNAVADALGRDDIALPLNLGRVWAFANEHKPTTKRRRTVSATRPVGSTVSDALSGRGEVILPARVEEVWRRLLDPSELAAIIPGCRGLTQDGADRYSAQVVIGVAGIRGTYHARVEIRDKVEGRSLRLVGSAFGSLGFGSGSGFMNLQPEADGRTRLEYRYEAQLGGKLAAVGQRMLGSVMRYLIAQFFHSLERRISPLGRPGWRGWWLRLRKYGPRGDEA
jgi:2-furoyl-CoA dehydrogenase large subunit